VSHPAQGALPGYRTQAWPGSLVVGWMETPVVACGPCGASPGMTGMLRIGGHVLVVTPASIGLGAPDVSGPRAGPGKLVPPDWLRLGRGERSGAGEHGPAGWKLAVGECGLAAGRDLARPDATNGGVEEAGRWPADGAALNIDGDGQGDLAGHGGEHRAVFVYQIDSYRYWQAQLGRTDFSYGQFGENFTVDGLADDEVCIGDRYRIGEALFEVTQPRVTCYRVGIRMDDPQIPALLISHHRPGFYLRVLREGAVQAGDEIVQVAAGARSDDGRGG
jgi:MOSC domain-containing protein YiiM